MHEEHIHEHAHFSLVAEPIEHLLEPVLTGWGIPDGWAEALVHMLADFIDISILLLLVVGLVSYLQTFIPYDKMKEKLKGIRGIWGCLLALGLGVLSPFCSCTIIPVLFGFLAAGVPLTYCLIFLTASSCMNLTALSAVFTAFPLSFSAVYLSCALLISVGSGFLVSKMKLTDDMIKWDMLHVEHDHHHHSEKKLSRLSTALCAAGEVYKNVWPFMLIGVAVSALVSGFVSEELISSLLVNNPVALPVATLLGGALHSDVFSILPIAQMLLEHSYSVALCFLLATMLFSVAEWALLYRAFKPRLIARYCGVLLGFALVVGVLARLIVGM